MAGACCLRLGRKPWISEPMAEHKVLSLTRFRAPQRGAMSSAKHNHLQRDEQKGNVVGTPDVPPVAAHCDELANAAPVHDALRFIAISPIPRDAHARE